MNDKLIHTPFIHNSSFIIHNYIHKCLIFNTLEKICSPAR
jgi:hypothetical protein